MDNVSKDEPYSLLGLVISDEGKKFYNIVILVFSKPLIKVPFLQ